jgi:hypothetical protein
MAISNGEKGEKGKDTLTLIITSTNGDKFINQNVNTMLKCCVFDSQGEVDADGTEYNYIWEKKVNGVKDHTWRDVGSVFGKTIEIN